MRTRAHKPMAGRFHLTLLPVAFSGLLASVCWANAAEDLYQKGRAAFEKGSYLDAVKYLYAFKQGAQPKPSGDFAKQLDSAIDYADEQIDVALRTKQELDKYGKVTQIVASGKADGFDGSPQRPPIKFPQPSGRQKPGLPASKPSSHHPPVVVAAPPVRAPSTSVQGRPGSEVIVPQPVKDRLSELESENRELRQKLENYQQENRLLRQKLEHAAPENDPKPNSPASRQ